MENQILVNPINDANIIANEINGENDWYGISKRSDLTIEQLREYKDHLYWPTVVFSQENPLPNDLLDEIITEEKITLNDRTSWERISKFHATDVEFIKKHNGRIDFKILQERMNFKPTELAKLIQRPEVGMGATECYSSDSYPFTVIEVNKAGTRIKVQSDNSKPAEGYDYYSNQIHEFTPNPNGSIHELRLNKFGKWVSIGGGKIPFVLGFRRKYQNPSF